MPTMKPVVAQMICRFASHMSLIAAKSVPPAIAGGYADVTKTRPLSQAVLTSRAQFMQPLGGAHQRLILFAEAEANLLRAEFRIAIER